MNRRRLGLICDALEAAGLRCGRFVIITVALLLLPLAICGQSSLTEYEDVREVLAFLNDSLPAGLKGADVSAQNRLWTEWVTSHNREIRNRLARGDADTVANWLLFGTSFTRHPRAFFDGPATQEELRRLMSQRTSDLIALLASPEVNERAAFTRQLLGAQGYGWETAEAQSRLVRHLYAEVDRVVSERQEFMLRENAAPAGDVIAQMLAQATLFVDRGLSLDTSVLAGFAVEQAFESMKRQGLIPSQPIRRVAVIGPGLDFADKNSGYDVYPVQTLQPFTCIDSLVRLGLSRPEEIEVFTLDISPRVNDHIRVLRDRARGGATYVLRLPRDSESRWTSELDAYWKILGRSIGSEAQVTQPPNAVKGMELRGIAVRPSVAARITPVDFNVVTEKWTGPPFDLVIATNVLVYYDKFDQALAFRAIDGMLRPGGLFLTNNVVVEPPSSRLRSVGLMTVQHSPDKVDHLFWYRRS